MILGILLGISAAVFLTSAIVATTGFTGALQINYITGAAIGTDSTVSYAVLSMSLSLIVTLFLITQIKK